jgi:hypothetical protein
VLVVLPGFESMSDAYMPFVSYGLLQNIKRSQQRKGSQGSLLEHTRLGPMDTSV